MTVRARIAWTLVGIGLLTAVAVLAAVLLAFQRFDRESGYRRGHEFLARVAAQHPELAERQRRAPDEVVAFLRNLVPYEPDTRVYLLDPDGRVLAASREPVLANAMVPPAVLAASLGRRPGMGQYLLGPDPGGDGGRMLVAAQPLRAPAIGAAGAIDGWLYFVCPPPLLETLQNRWADAAAEDRELLAMALRNTRDTARLVQALGDLSQLDEPAFQLRRESLDIGELLADVVQRFASRAQAQGVRLQAVEPGGPMAASVDVELIERALANLLDNALKFCPAGSSVILSAHSDGDRLRLQVRDSGPGIPAEAMPRLFERFYQRRAGGGPDATGRGLGLAIVRRIAELHGGEARIDSAPGTGTCVTLLLPVAEPAAPVSASLGDRP